MKPPSHQDAKEPADRVPWRLGVVAVLFLIPLALWMWLAMMLVHELGHVVAAVATGGRLVHVNLYPGQLSSTLVRPNPRPSVVLWAGILGGWLVPGLMAIAARRAPILVRQVVDCWAAFCLLAGGVYLAVGGTERLTDTGQLVDEGWPVALLIATGAAAAVLGYAWSRRAWPPLLENLNKAERSRSTALAAGLILGVWIVGQWAIATWLDRLTNVR